MRTSKEMQLKILDKMRENVESGIKVNDSIQVFTSGAWHNSGINFGLDFEYYQFRVKPETITINGVEIPKPLSDGEFFGNNIYYYPCNNKDLHGGEFGCLIKDKGIRFVYKTSVEAIEASKALFGITG